MATILVADDDPLVLGSSLRLLKQFKRDGHIIITASNGREAWDLMQRGGIDAVILDNTMPEIKGLQVASLANTAKILPPGFLYSGETYITIAGRDYCIHQIAKESGLFGAVCKPIQDICTMQRIVTDLLTAETDTPSFDNLRRYFAEQWKDYNWQLPQAHK